MELLLTMPITTWQAIVGKFVASWLFLALALLLTFPLVFTVGYLGSPDYGIVLCGYTGSILMAGAYLAISCMTSALTRNQVVSFILSVVICLFLILAGWPPVTNLVRSFPNWLLETVAGFSVMPHFEGFQKGVLDSRDALFFLTMIVFALFTTGVIIRSHRAG
jgi:ABC-2 type transport system permease protein